MRTFNINDVYIDELLNTSKLLDIFKYRCIIRNNDILNEQFLNELARKINVTPSNLEIYHNWFLINDKYYYFKHYYIFEELLMEQIFKAFDVPTVNHEIVSFNGKAGIISENFRKQDCEYLNYEDVIPLEIDVPSHIIDYNSVIKTQMSDSDYKNYIELVSKIMAVDIMFGQFDHKYYNIMFEKSNTHLKLTPMFDNGCIFKEQASESTYVFKSCFDTLTFSLKSKNIDAQGFFEYIRSIIEKEGIEIEKIWKEDKDAPEKRYERCLIFKINEKTYLVDSIKKELVEVKKEKMDKKIFIFNPSENMYSYYGG